MGGELHILLLSYFIYIIKVLLHIISTLARAIFYLHIVPYLYAKVESYQCDGVGVRFQKVVMRQAQELQSTR